MWIAFNLAAEEVERSPLNFFILAGFKQDLLCHAPTTNAKTVVAPPDRATPDEDSIPIFLCFNFLTQRAAFRGDQPETPVGVHHRAGAARI